MAVIHEDWFGFLEQGVLPPASHHFSNSSNGQISYISDNIKSLFEKLLHVTPAKKKKFHVTM